LNGAWGAGRLLQIADVLVGGVLCPLVSLGSFGFQSLVARVRAGAEVTASPRLVYLLNIKYEEEVNTC
jgi:hypothetical protein